MTPRSQLYLGARGRLMVGLEAMYLQGIHYGSRQVRLLEVHRNQESLVADLAGNAFHTWCCAAMVLVRELIFATAFDHTQRAAAAARTHGLWPDLGLTFNFDSDEE